MLRMISLCIVVSARRSRDPFPLPLPPDAPVIPGTVAGSFNAYVLWGI